MTFIRKLKKTKDMTDDELIEEFRVIQKIAKQRGEHIPLPVTARDQGRNGQTPPIHRGETEKQLQALRADFEKDSEASKEFEQRIPGSSKQQMAQNTPTSVAKGANKARGVHSLSDAVRTGLDLLGLARQKNYADYKTMGQIGIPRDEFMDKHGDDPEAVKAYEEGLKEANMTSTERAKRQKEEQK